MESGNRESEPVAIAEIACGHLRLLGPHCTAANKHIRGAGVCAAVVVKKSSDHHRVSIDRYGVPEAIPCGSVACGQFGLLSPCRAAAHKHVGRARSVPFLIIRRCPDHCCIAADGDGDSEELAYRTVACGESGLLSPCCAAVDVYVSRFAQLGSDHSSIAADGNGPSEVVPRHAIVGEQFGLVRSRACGRSGRWRRSRGGRWRHAGTAGDLAIEGTQDEHWGFEEVEDVWDAVCLNVVRKVEHARARRQALDSQAD